MFRDKAARRATSGGLVKFLVLAAALFATAPASANSLAVATAATAADSFRIADHDHRDVVATPLGESDSRFRTLFDNWGRQSAQPRVEVSVPAINPVDMSRVRKSSGFGSRAAPLRGASTNHKGVDLAAPIGTPIYATADGIVSRAEWANGYGKLIELNHGNQIQTRYGHLSAMNVTPNQRVRKGDIIGFMGSTGRSTGSHLHYEVRVAGQAVNPVAFMATERRENNVLFAKNETAIPAMGGPVE